MKQLSIQFRLVYSFVIIATISILLVGILTLGISLRIFNNREEEYLNRIADEAALQIKLYYGEKNHGSDITEALSRFGLTNNVALRIENPNGQVLAESYVLTDNPGTGLTEGGTFPLMPVARKTLGFPPLEGASLEVLRFDEYFFHPVSLMVEGMLIAAAAALFSSILMGRYSGRKIARPIKQLSAFASEISARHWDRELPGANSSELEELTRSLDSMRVQLASSFHVLEEERDVMKRFLQDASHQLRTPVTALHTFLELLKSDLPAVDDRRPELLEDSLLQVEKLSRIIRDLMELTRIESGQSSENKVLVSLKDLCRQAWKGIQERAEEKELFLDLSGPSGNITGDPHLIEMALSNILDNGVKWSPHGARLIVRLKVESDSVSVHIADQGPGIPPADLDRLFERFFQTSDSTQDGSGLGLAVVKQIMDNTGGTVSVGNGRDGGAWFELIFPVTPGGL